MLASAYTRRTPCWRDRLDFIEEAASNPLSLMVGMNVKHVDMPVGSEVAESCEITIDGRHTGRPIGGSPAEALGIDIVGHPGHYLCRRIIAPGHLPD